MTAVATPQRIADTHKVDTINHALARIPLADIHESPLNPRTSYNPQALEELKESLLSSGQLTPVIVRARAAGGYELAAGHRRYRAAKLACEKSAQGAAVRGLDHLWAVVRALDDRTFIEVLNIENLQRDDLHPLEEAVGFRQLMEKAGYDAAKIAARIGRSVKYVYDRIKLLQLVPEAKKMFAAGEFEAGHAIILARLTPAEQKQAISRDNEGTWHKPGGIFTADYAHAHPDLPAQERLKLEEGVKPVSVREFQTWVDDHIRLTPERIDPMLFPETTLLLSAAQEEDLKVVHITHDYRVPDAARDAKQRTYGEHGWKRADGKKGSKECDYQVVGVVVAGPGAGEAFKVCVRKDKCKTHWAKEQRDLAADRKQREKHAGAHPSADRYDPVKERAAQAAREAERDRWRKAEPALAKALAAKLETAPLSKIIAIVLDGRIDEKHASRYMPNVRGPVEVLRNLAFDFLSDRLLDNWNLYETKGKALKDYGIDAKAIVDEVAPKPAEKEPAKAPAKKKGAK